MEIKRVHNRALILYTLAALTAIITFFISPLTEMRLALMALIFGAFFISAYFIALNGHRCPDCDQLLPLHLRLTRKCPHCGKIIEYPSDKA